MYAHFVSVFVRVYECIYVYTPLNMCVPPVCMRAVSYTCESGQNPENGEIKKTADNSKESCAAACDALQECGAFDFTERKIGWSCRLVKGDKAPRSYGGDDKRKYCKGTS